MGESLLGSQLAVAGAPPQGLQALGQDRALAIKACTPWSQQFACHGGRHWLPAQVPFLALPACLLPVEAGWCIPLFPRPRAPMKAGAALACTGCLSPLAARETTGPPGLGPQAVPCQRWPVERQCYVNSGAAQRASRLATAIHHLARRGGDRHGTVRLAPNLFVFPLSLTLRGPGCDGAPGFVLPAPSSPSPPSPTAQATPGG